MKKKLSSLEELLDEIDKKDSAQRDRGTMFENVSLVYFKNEPMYKQRFSEVWALNDVPSEYDIPKKDVGVDLVAKERITGDLVAIQCKYYDSATIIQKGHIDSFLNEIGKKYYASGIIVASSPNWSNNAENALKDRDKKIARIGFEDLLNSHIDWSKYSPSKAEAVTPLKPRKTPRPHQVEAIEAAIEGFKEQDRGKLIMAPGTGKTYTSLQIAESLAKEKDGQFRVLYLVPSIQLLSQSLRGWTGDSIYANDMNTIAVCSDRNVTRKESQNVEFDISVADIGYPATTNSQKLLEYKNTIEEKNIDNKFLVVFSTYQSVEVISQAQQQGFYEFDLIVADEAHRTTGATKLGENGSAFVQVHNNKVIKGNKRLYQTATPRVYGDNAKTKADEMSVIIADMDDEKTYGPEFFRLGFGKAVHSGILTDYKVMVLAVNESMVQKEMQRIFANDNNELEFDDVTKIIGCWNGLLKRKDNSNKLAGQPMKRAIAFTNTIANSQLITDTWQTVVDEYVDQGSADAFKVEIQHADGSMNALQKNQKINWLKSEVPDRTCRILSNARFLTEGVDVPDLDAVMFLNPRKSKIDIAQAVGRVMRKHPGKEYGYVILPIGVPDGVSANQVLDNNERYEVVWDVLNALRSIDERFDATINKLELNKKKPGQINVIGVNGGSPEVNEEDGQYIVDTRTEQLSLSLTEEEWSELEHAIYGKIVEKVGNTRYWESWSKDVTEIAQQHITRINAMLESEPATASAFDKFLKGLRHNINDSVTVNEAVEMLAQHMITKPVFNALFEEESFALNNPISQAMDVMIQNLELLGLSKEQEQLEGFYESVRIRAEGIDNLEAKQTIIVQLYEKFFKVGFPKTTERLGIVFTPVEIVDFIISFIEGALKKHLGKSLSDRNVNILDPFTGTGTFITRLLQSRIIETENLLYKYTNEIYANELILLSYYIAAINIEETFKEVYATEEYQPYEGIVLTDTFESTEHEDVLDNDIFGDNNTRLQKQKITPITVIMGNPPYSGRQRNENDENENTVYTKLHNRILNTYLANSKATASHSVYDSYIKAIRWATDRISDGNGVIGYVTQNSYIDNHSLDGVRESLYKEFNYIYIINLKGAIRGKSREYIDKIEGKNVFDIMSGVAIVILVKDGSSVHEINYFDIGDGLSKEDKLNKLRELKQSLDKIEFVNIIPDEFNDWINQKDISYYDFIPLFESKAKSIFNFKQLGINSKRDDWVYGFSSNAVQNNVKSMIDEYENNLNSGTRNMLATKISWSDELIRLFDKKEKIDYSPKNMVTSLYRPFTKKHLYLEKSVIARPGSWKENLSSENLVLLTPGKSNRKNFSVLITNLIPDQNIMDAGAHGYLMYTYNPNSLIPLTLNIDESVIKEADISAENIIYYIYGLLHSRDYIDEFNNNLKKDFARVPIVNNKDVFIEIGKRLAELHLNYEQTPSYENVTINKSNKSEISYQVKKMTFPWLKENNQFIKDEKGKKIRDKSTIIFNNDITISNIPSEAYNYIINGRSAIEWIMDQYQLKINGQTGIVDNPNEYSDNPKYIFNLLLSIINVSVQTVELTNNLPPLEIIE